MLAQQQRLSLLVNLYLLVYGFYAFVNGGLAWVLEVTGRLIKAVDDGGDCLLLQFGSLLQVQEI